MWLPITGWLLVALLLVLSPQPVAAASPQPSMVSSDPEVLELGRRLFEQNGSPCHGKNAVGEDPATPMGGWKDGSALVSCAHHPGGSDPDLKHPPSRLRRTHKHTHIREVCLLHGVPQIIILLHI
jgi:hypothetical protein